jgi:hypothetical protein
VETALLARDISPDAIRKGADRAEILVDLDEHSVRRVITPKGSTLTVTRDGMKATKPQTYLVELLGTSSLDPMDLLLLKGKERRAKVLEALPVTVSVEQLRRWVPRLPESFDTSGHGLEVLERVRAKAYDQRTAANAAAKGAKAEAEKAAESARLAATVAPRWVPDVAGLEAAEKAARDALAAVRARAEEHKRSEERTASTRRKSFELHDEAVRLRALVLCEEPAPEKLQAAEHRAAAAKARAKRLEDELAIARADLEKEQAELVELRRTVEACAVKNARVLDLLEQAKGLEVAIDSAMVSPVTDEEMARAVLAEAEAHKAVLAAKAEAHAAREADEAARKAEDLKKTAWESETEAARLDAIVRALTNDAPAELLAACDGIPGLTVSGDDILLDGVALDSLCGAEQVRFCVEVARRANAKAKILIVDGLERLDPETMDVFVREATRDGFQLIGTRVDRGGVVIEAIEPTNDPTTPEDLQP